MHTPTATGSGMIDSLRRRESATAAMIRDIDDKLSRLNSARKERAAALNRIRCELVRAHNAEQVASARHERANGIH